MIPSLGQLVGRNSAAYCAGCFPALGRYTFGGIRPSAYSALRTTYTYSPRAQEICGRNRGQSETA